DDSRLGEDAAVDLEERHLAEHRALDEGVVLRRLLRVVLLVFDALLEQHEPNLVVIVAEAESAEPEHSTSPSRRACDASVSNTAGGGMPLVRVESFALSLDGYGAGVEQSLENPLGRGGTALHGSGENLFAGIDLPSLGYRCLEHVPTSRVTHVV